MLFRRVRANIELTEIEMSTLYDQDFYAWANEQAALRAGTLPMVV